MPDDTGKRTVLLVEPDEDSRQLLIMVLRRRGPAVLHADCVETALDLFYHFEPSLIVTEVNLPLSAGLAFLRTVRAAQMPRRTAVIVLTTMVQQAVQEQVSAAGCDLFIAKPFSLKSLDQAVQHFLSSAVQPTPVSLRERSQPIRILPPDPGRQGHMGLDV
jgi:DNA-binding response OmpR family regulator